MSPERVNAVCAMIRRSFGDSCRSTIVSVIFIQKSKYTLGYNLIV